MTTPIEFDIVTPDLCGGTDTFRTTKVPGCTQTYNLSLIGHYKVLFSVSQIVDLVEGLLKLKKLHES